MKTQYFKDIAGAPAPLRATINRKVRFEEVDPLGIVWHGRYPSFFDDARVKLGDGWGMGYLDYLDHGVVTPIRQLRVDHYHPLSYPETFTVEATLHWCEAARINYEFIVRDGNDRVLTTGCTVQLMLDMEHNVLMVPPPFLAEIREQWQAGTLEPIGDAITNRTRLVDRLGR